MNNSLNRYSEVIKEAGGLLRTRFEQRYLFADPEQDRHHGEGEVRTKSAHELVLGVDLLSEKILVQGARDLLPGCGVYSEEMDNWDDFPSDRRLKCVIDPLDGTHNYHFGIPQWGISVAFLNEDHIPLVGFIYIPMFDLLLTNAGGGRSVLEYKGQRVPVSASRRVNLSESLVAYDNQFYRLGEEAFEFYHRITQSCFTTRISGSAAFDAAMVTLGKFDARVWNRVEVYDIAAAIPLVRGAGGVVCDFTENEDLSVFHRRFIICGNREFAHQLVALVPPRRKIHVGTVAETPHWHCC